MRFLDSRVPVDEYDEFVEDDGSTGAERTKGERSARCGEEPTNLLSINLGHDICTDERSAEEARHAATVNAAREPSPSPYAVDETMSRAEVSNAGNDFVESFPESGE